MLPTETNTATETGYYDQDLTAYSDDNSDNDVVESALRTIDNSVKNATGTSLFHILTLGSIGGSIALYASGRRSLGIFIGLWAPTFQALKAASENKKDYGHQ